MKRVQTIIPGILCFVFMIMAVSQNAQAIPAFARKYKFSCSTCHQPFPRLKEFGEEFAGRGFRLEDPSQEPKRATYDTGDTILALPRSVPLAIRMDGFLSFKEDHLAEKDTEFPWAFKIASGGPLSNTISYYFYYILERGESGKLEDAYFQFNSLFGTPINLIAGQFQVSDPLFKRELRLERFDYQIYKTRVGSSSVDLTYDRGLMFLWTFPGEIDTTFQVVNGSGIDEADHDKNFDNDDNKNFGLRLSRSFGPVRIGVYGYLGKETDINDFSNETTYLGPDMTISFGDNVELNLQYLERTDDNPVFMADPAGDITTEGGFAELQFFPEGPDGRLAISFLYNKIDSDDPGAVYEEVSLTVNRLLARNIRLLLEAGRDLERQTTRATVGVVTAF